MERLRFSIQGNKSIQSSHYVRIDQEHGAVNVRHFSMELVILTARVLIVMSARKQLIVVKSLQFATTESVGMAASAQKATS